MMGMFVLGLDCLHVNILVAILCTIVLEMLPLGEPKLKVPRSLHYFL